MNTPNTPVHIRLWNKDFWLLITADLLLTMSAYMLLPTLPSWLMEAARFSPLEGGIAVGAFALGLYVMGAWCSWLVQHHRRNVVCMWSVAGVAVSLLLLLYLQSLRPVPASLPLVVLLRLLMGAAFGLAQMVLSSTLIIDTCESSQRTEANYVAAWFSRFALSLGPLLGLLLCRDMGFERVLWMAVALCVVSLLLIGCVSFPFRSPEEHVHARSLDRFFLPHGFVLFANLLLVSMSAGLLLALPLPLHFYATLMGGFLLALLARRFVFRDAELKSEVVSGLILQLFAIAVLWAYPYSPFAPLLCGVGLGITSSRFLLFFIKLSRHCQRGTSQSTCFLSWETGLWLGAGLGCALSAGARTPLLIVSMCLAAVALGVYHFFAHDWFLRNKTR